MAVRQRKDTLARLHFYDSLRVRGYRCMFLPLFLSDKVFYNRILQILVIYRYACHRFLVLLLTSPLVVRAHGLQHVRAEKSWRAIVTVTVGDHQCHELSLGCDGQNPNIKQCFQFSDIDASSRIDICVYHRALTKKKNKRRNLVASARCTLQELARLQAQQQCKERSIDIKLNPVSQQKGGANKAKPITILLVARLDLPEVCKAQLTCVQEDVRSDILSEDPEDREYSSSPTTDSGEDPSFLWPEPHHPEPKVYTGYWSDSDRVQSEDGRDLLLKRRDNEPILVPLLSDSEDNSRIKNRKRWFAASALPTYTETISMDSQICTIDSIVDSFSPYRELREARVDSDYERVLTELCTEWRFVGGSAGVFGFSSGTTFTITNFAKGAIAVGSVASGIGLTIDAWFLLAYCNTTPAKFQKMALDVYGKYLFFCISARIPAICMFTSAFALTTFLLSVAWTAWPSAVLVMSFLAGVLFSLQFIVYGVHCVVVLIAEVARRIRRGILRCIAWIRPPPPDMQEKHTLEK
ncbi:hypothetical protein HD554DRAFT_2071470 [Boletus coccyginus]|nr:hypothetical protein HD554DRAFT_2071470 [Boletus coccyginus]